MKFDAVKTIYDRLKSHAVFQLARNSIFYGVGNFLQKFMSVFLLPIYTRYLVPADYGVIALLGIFTMVVTTVTMCGLTNGISRYFYYADRESTNRSEVVWSPLLFIMALTVLVVAALSSVSGILSNHLFDTPEHRYLINLALLNILVSNISSIGRAVLIFEERVWTVNLINIIGVAAGAGAGITMVAFLGRGVSGAVEGGLIGSAVMGITSFMVSIQRYTPGFNLTILQKQLRFSLPLVAAVFAFFFMDSSDRYLLRAFLPLSEVGLYNIGYQMGMLMMLLVSGFSMAWPPFYHRNNQNGEGQAICYPILRMYLPVAATFAVMISLASPTVLQLLTTERYHEAYTVVPWVALAYMLKGPYIIFLMGVLMKNKTAWQLYLEIFAAILNIGLNILLIPIIGKEGAAITTLLSYAVMTMGSYLMVMRINPIPHLSRNLVVFTITGALTFSSVGLLLVRYEYYPIFATLVFMLFVLLMVKYSYNDIRKLKIGLSQVT